MSHLSLQADIAELSYEPGLCFLGFWFVGLCFLFFVGGFPCRWFLASWFVTLSLSLSLLA